ncbi:MAG: topoisomerase C-terminal repeat-containing protein, partial [Paracoccaceae bacterium]
ATAAPLKELGKHPDGGAVQVMNGRYGPYVKWAKINATLPKGTEPEAVTMEEALALIAAKAAKGGKTPRKAAAKKAAPKAAAKKKAAPKKAAAKKS